MGGQRSREKLIYQANLGMIPRFVHIQKFSRDFYEIFQYMKKISGDTFVKMCHMTVERPILPILGTFRASSKVTDPEKKCEIEHFLGWLQRKMRYMKKSRDFPEIYFIYGQISGCSRENIKYRRNLGMTA